MKLFKKKSGGSFLGNLLAGAANHFTAGLLGNGKHRQTNQQNEGDDRPWWMKLFD